MLDHSGIPGLYLFGGVQPGDYIVSSEPYGAKLAELTGGIFMPYDPNRELYYTKATDIRENMEKYFHDIMPTFQRHLMTKVVVFGAESTGKTTLSKELSCSLNAHWLFEYARPYLECVGPAITKDSMRAIWEGQYALEESARYLHDKPYLIQDTDLFSTVGYWEQPHWTESLGAVPKELVYDAQKHKADLYIITKSNIAFEQDPIRYGGDHRESPDDYWIDVAERYDLNYRVLEDSDMIGRLSWSMAYAKIALAEKAESIAYDRKGF